MDGRDLRALPKGHLHLHLEAAMRPATLAELATASGVEIPPVAGFSGFAAFAGMYQGLLAVLAEPENPRRLIDEAAEDAADDLGAHRVQHGVRAVEDPELVALLAERGICLDVCPTSNLILEVVDDLAAHPLPQLLAAGVRCSINADDPILFGPGILDEYVVSRGSIGLTDEQLAACAWSSIETTLASEEVKRRARPGDAHPGARPRDGTARLRRDRDDGHGPPPAPGTPFRDSGPSDRRADRLERRHGGVAERGGGAVRAP